MSNETIRIKKLGNLDSVVVSDCTLTIEEATSLQSNLAGYPCQVVEQVLHIPSADVKAVWPAMDDSKCCRFLCCVSDYQIGCYPL